MDMEVPYERSGRRNQKARTRAALVESARTLLGRGAIPNVDDVARESGISRTTAYRYFPNQRALLGAVRPEIDQSSLLPDPAPTDPRERLELVMREAVRITLEWEPELRASLKVSLEERQADAPVLRRGRAIGWIEDALTPLRETRPDVDVHRMAVAIRSATGIESLIWLVDVAGLSRDDAAIVLNQNALAVFDAALDRARRMRTYCDPNGPDDNRAPGDAGRG